MQVLQLLQKVLQQQEEQGRQLAALSQNAARGGAAAAASSVDGGTLLEAVQVRASKQIKLDGGSAVTTAVAEQDLVGGKEVAAMIAACAVETETQRRRVVAFQEFVNWFVPRARAMPGHCADPYQATPEELIAYHQQYWVHTHGETLLKGRIWPAPGSVEANFSYLSGIFESAGRTGLYNTQLQLGNPVQSKLVRDYKEGYARLMRDIGFATTSAVHMKEEKLVKLILLEDSLLQEAGRDLDWSNKNAAVKYLLVERDLLMLCGLWQCCSRGKEMGVLEKERVQDRNGHSLFPHLVAMEVSAGLPYQIAPKGTKKVQRNRAGVILLEAESEEKKALCLLRRMQQHTRSCMAAGVVESKYILRAETRDHSNLKLEGLSSSIMNKRMQSLLQKHSLFEGETLHGIRRGSMQQAAAEGKTVEEIGAKALQKTREVTVAYLDTSRETNGPVRVRGKRQPYTL